MSSQADRGEEEFLKTLNLTSIALFFAFVIGYVIYHFYQKKVLGKRTADVAEQLKSKFALQDGITVYGYPVSPCFRRVILMLEELELKYRVVYIELTGEQKSAEYMRISPNGKVPAIVFHNTPQYFDGDTKTYYLYESNVITEFLDKNFRENEAERLYPPGGSFERLQVYTWQAWDLEITQYVRIFGMHNTHPVFNRLLHSSKQSYMSSVQCTADTPQSIVMQNIDAYSGENQRCTELMELYALAAYRLLLRVENTLQGKHYLVGNKYSIADLSVFPRLDLIRMFGIPLPSQHFPNICSYMKRIGERKSVSRTSNVMLRAGQVLLGTPWIRSLALRLATWRSGLKTTWFDASKMIDRAIGEQEEVAAYLKPDREYIGQTILYDYLHHPDCWALKLLLMYKVSRSLKNLPSESFRENWQAAGKTIRMEQLDSVDLIGRPFGSCFTHKAQLTSGDVITGTMAILQHFASSQYSDFAQEHLTSDDTTTVELGVGLPEVQCWVMWCQALYQDVTYALMEHYVFSRHLQNKYTEEDIMALKSEPMYTTSFLDVIKVYSQRLDTRSDTWRRLQESHPFLQLGAIDDDVITEHITSLHKRLQYVDSKLQNQTYLHGESVTLADIVVFSHLLFMPFIGMKISTQKYPRLCQWINKLKQIPSFHAVHKQLESTMKDL